MKAVVQVVYGSADVLEFKEIDKPVANDDDVLMRVHAASLVAGDCFALRGMTFPVRMCVGFPKPKKDHDVGVDLAGRVQTIGKNVTRFKPGDEVFGECSLVRLVNKSVLRHTCIRHLDQGHAQGKLVVVMENGD